jgi:hypothetical protein
MTDMQGRADGDTTDKPPEDRLESWKRISNYLNRDIRTLRRWEKSEGLPVHRQMHQSLASVYAYKSELDAWVASRSAKKPASQRNSYTRHRFTRTIAIAVLAVAIAVLAIFIYQQKPVPAKLAFEARDWILITRIDNRTGNDLFDGTLEYSLQSELSNSPYVNVVSRERIADTLARMKLPRTSPIDTDIGRRCCQAVLNNWAAPMYLVQN